MPGLVIGSPPSVGLLSGDPSGIISGSGPLTGLSGPAGIDAVIEYNSNYINMRKNLDAVLVNEIAGFGDADVRDQREVNPAQHGETPFDAYYGGRTLVLTGKIRAHTLAKMRDMQMGLRQIFSDLTQERPLIFHTQDPTLDLYINCKKNQPMVMDDIQQNLRFERDFQITLRASNPRFLSNIQQSLSTSSAGLFPSPTLYPGPTVYPSSPGLYNTPINITNNGNFNAQPVYTINGPITNPSIQVIFNAMSVGTIVINGSVASGSLLVFNIANRTMVDQAGVDQFSMLDPSSGWPELPPGTSSVQLTGTGTSSLTSLVVQWNHTYI